MAGPAVFRMGGQRLRLLQQVSFGGVGQGQRLLGAIGRVDEDQFADDFAGAGTEAGRMAVGA